MYAIVSVCICNSSCIGGPHGYTKFSPSVLMLVKIRSPSLCHHPLTMPFRLSSTLGSTCSTLPIFIIIAVQVGAAVTGEEGCIVR